MLTRNGKRTLDEYFNDTDSPTLSSPPPDSEQPPAKKKQRNTQKFSTESIFPFKAISMEMLKPYVVSAKK